MNETEIGKLLTTLDDVVLLSGSISNAEARAALQRLLEAVHDNAVQQCEQAACVIVNRYHPGQAEAIVGREIVRAIREAGKR